MADDAENGQVKQQAPIVARVFIDPETRTPGVQIADSIEHEALFCLTCAQLFIGRAAQIEDEVIKAGKTAEAQIQRASSRIVRPNMNLRGPLKVVD